MNAKHSPGNWCAEFVGVAGPQDNPSHDVFEITNGHDRIAENVHERDAALLVAAPTRYEIDSFVYAIESEARSHRRSSSTSRS